MKTSPTRIALSLVAAVGISAAITVLYLGMRAVMAVGGYCASGGPYQIRVECPDAIPVLMPLSIFAGLGFLFLFLATAPPRVKPFIVLAWTALFGALGWNFIDSGLPWHGQEFALLGILLGTMFWIMAAVPLVFFVGMIRNGSTGYQPAKPLYIGTQRQQFGSGAASSPQAPIPPPMPAQDISQSLTRLATLHRNGELTDGEYIRAKRKLLEDDR